MKHLEIIGNIGRDAEVRTSANGKSFLSFSVAVSDGEKTTWFGVISSASERLKPYLVKGRQVYVAGRFSVGMYKNEPQIDVFADSVELCGTKTEAQQEATGPVTPQGEENPL